MRAFVRVALVLFSAGLIAVPAAAQRFPSGPVRIIVAVPPGIPNDVLARGLTDPLSKVLSVPVFVENRVGADGIIGTAACAKSAPDGQTLCSTGNAVMSLNPAMRAKLPYDPLKDFAGVALIGFFDSCLAVNAALPANSVKELIDLARSRPDSVNWGHFGLNSTGYLYGAWLKKGRSAPFYTVPYKTPAQLLQALITGESQAAVYGFPLLMPHLNSGKLKCLAVTSPRRVDFLANVPTFREEGIKLPLRPWFAWHYQASTPRPIVARMNSEIRKIMTQPDYRSIMTKMGIEAADGSPEELDAFVRAEITETVDLIKFLGIKPIEE